jgi:membrane protein implicated in regulation of membrane protease activity
VNFAEPYILFFCAAFLLLIIEVLLGMTLGVALAGAITFFILGILSLVKILSAFNHYLIAGSIIFFSSTFAVLVFFRKIFSKKNEAKDVNNY